MINHNCIYVFCRNRIKNERLKKFSNHLLLFLDAISNDYFSSCVKELCEVMQSNPILIDSDSHVRGCTKIT